MQRGLTVCLLTIFLYACAARSAVPDKSVLYIYRLDPSALVELSTDYQPAREIPISMPEGCALNNFFAPPFGATLAIELNCSFGQAVVWLNTNTGEIKQPITDSDSHFLAWTPDGEAVYLKADSINRPHIVRAALTGGQEFVPITELTYDLAPGANPSDFLFSFSRGMGLGSEMYLAQVGGRVVQRIIASENSYLSFARWSPDGKKIAFIKIPDSSTPFTVGELWVMEADGAAAHKLADVDAGHGFAAAWSPDGSQIAFVARDNPEDALADQYADALLSNIQSVDVQKETTRLLTNFQNARLETPSWSPDGNKVAFTVVMNDKMYAYAVDVVSGGTKRLYGEGVCCPVWMR
jgi:Tol biopolymer transport system component